ncbi:MAG: hypothetical protein ABEJ75_02200 [Candidatus Nanohaloarchaea archaeon]
MEIGISFTLLVGVFSGFVAGMAFWSFRDVFGLSDAPGRELASYLPGSNYVDATYREARSAEIVAAALLGGTYAVLYHGLAVFTSGAPALSHSALTLAVLYGLLVPFTGAEMVDRLNNSPEFLEAYRRHKLKWGFLYFVYGTVLGIVFHFAIYTLAI